MNRPPITAKRVLIAVVVLLLLLSQLPSNAATKVSYVPRTFIAWITRPATLLTSISTTLRPSHYDSPMSTGEGSLEEQLAYAKEQLEQAKIHYDRLEQENFRLRNINENLAIISALVESEHIDYVGAKVIGFNGDLKNPILTISIGSAQEGVREGLAVVWGADLVGKVVSTSVQTSDVKLITAAGTKLQVRITPPTVDPNSTPMPAYLELAKDGRSFQTDEFALDSPVKVGDLALLADESWQSRARGFIVGTVTQAGPHPDRPLLNKRVIVRPNRALASLDSVVVLVPSE